MKIKKSVLSKINTTENRLKIALAVKQSERSVEMAIQKNTENGPLTKAVVLKTIREITGLSDEEILLTAKVAE